MVDMQQDMVDVIARELIPSIIQVAEKVISEASKHDFGQDKINDIK